MRRPRRVPVDRRGERRLARGETRIDALLIGGKYSGYRRQLVESCTEILINRLRPLSQRQAERGFKFGSSPNRPARVVRKSRAVHVEAPSRKRTQIPSKHVQLRVLR